MNTTHEIQCGEALLHLLQTQEIDCVFCSPLSVWAPLWESFAKHQAQQRAKDSPRYVNCRHELLAVGLASGYYKAAGRMQAVLLPTALGVLNGSMAIRGAYQERVPLVILAPDSFSFGEIPGRDPGAEWPPLLGDLGGPVRIAEGYVKWAKEVRTPQELISAFRRACYIAETVPRGPVLLAIPFEVLIGTVAFEPRKKIIPFPVAGSDEGLKAAADLVSQSNDPIIITDHAGRSPHDVRAITVLAELLGAPVFEFWMPTQMNIPRTHPLRGAGPVEEVLDTADCILVIANDAPWHPPLRDFRNPCNVIVLEEDPMRPRASYWGYKTDYCIAGDVGINVRTLIRYVRAALKKRPGALRIREKRTQRWHAYNDRKRKELAAQLGEPAHSQRIHAGHLFQSLDDILPKDAIIVDEVIAQLTLMMQLLFRRRSYSHYRGIAGGLGTGIPTALGVKLAEPQRPVVCIIGDGSFSYNPIPACFGLCQQYQLPLLIIICNNQAFASQAWNIQKYFPDGWAVKTNNLFGPVIEPTPDYSKIAPAFGGYGERVERADALIPALKRGLDAIRSGRLALIDVLVEP